MNPHVTPPVRLPGLLSRGCFALCLLLPVASLRAQDVEPVKPVAEDPGQPVTDKVVQLETFTVTSKIETYHQETSQMASKIPMDLKDLPSSLSIMNATAISDRNATSLVDVFGYVVGAVQSQGNINGFSFRGFPNTGSYTQNIQFDGLQGATQKKASTSAANVDSLEFLKGPNSVLYGQMNPGGLLNIVTKSPKEVRSTYVRVAAATFAGEFTDPGSKNNISTSIDTTGPVGQSKKLFYRLVADVGSTPSSRPGFDHYFSAYPSITYKWSKDTTLTFKGEISRDTRQQDDGVLPIFTSPTITVVPQVNRPAVVTAAYGNTATYYTAPLNTIYQDSKDRGLDYGEALAGFFHTTLGEWTLRAQFRSVWHVDVVRELTINNANVYSPTAAYATPTSLLRRQYNNVQNGHRYNYADANAFRKFGPEKFENTVLIGAGGGAEAFLNKRISFGPNQTAAQAITLINPLLNQFDYPADGTGATDVATFWTSVGEYISDQIKIGEKIHLSVGTRHDDIKIHGANALSVALTQFTNKYSVWTKQAGLVYDLTPTLSAYGSWSQSLKPGSNLAFDASGNSAFPPESGEQIEGGLKFQTPSKNLNVTFANYVITRANVVVPSGTNFTTAVGGAVSGQAISRLDREQKSKGQELEIQWQPMPNWQLQAGGAYSKATITQSDNPASIGANLINAPHYTGNIWTRYNFPSGGLKGLGFGGGIIYVGKAWAGDPTTALYYPLKAWKRVDASVYYKMKRYDFALNIQNVLDTRYISSSQSATTMNVGEQRKLTLSVGIRL
ncbi:MAG: Iron complex outerrane recepter protein [Lacunisphaera sp.]|nr:Iron complex outerrane recepter protein [Lacunisphaera sp.]